MLPLTAFLVRLTIILPVTIHARRRTQIEADLFPLMLAWKHQTLLEIMKNNGGATRGWVKRENAKVMRIKRREIYKRWGVQRWKLFMPPLIQIPIWFAFMETIRRMCGSEGGVLVPMLAKFGLADPHSSQAASELGGGESSILEAAGVVGSKVGIESGFATEGVLWFPDLLVADPFLVPLPALLSCVTLLNITTPFEKKAILKSKWQVRIYRMLIGFGIAIAPVTMGLPAALHVYWISSSAVGLVQNYILSRLMPLKRPIKPLKSMQPELGGDPLSRFKGLSPGLRAGN